MKRKAFFPHLSISKYPFVKSPFAELRPHFDLKVVKLGQKSVLLILRHTFRIPKTSGLTSCYLVNGGAFNYKTLCPRQNPNSFMRKCVRLHFQKTISIAHHCGSNLKKVMKEKCRLHLPHSVQKTQICILLSVINFLYSASNLNVNFGQTGTKILVNFGFCTLKISKNWVFSQMMKLHRTSNIVQSW